MAAPTAIAHRASSPSASTPPDAAEPARLRETDASPPPSKRRKGSGMWQAIKQAKKDAQSSVIASLPFTLPASPRIAIYISKPPASALGLPPKKSQAALRRSGRNRQGASGPAPKKHQTVSRLPPKQQAAVSARELTNVPHSGEITYAAIANPNYNADELTPRFAAIRFPKCVSPEAAAALEQLVLECESKGLKAKATKSHGSEFQQIWLGLWKKYGTEPSFSAHSRPVRPGLDAAIRKLMRAMDETFSPIAQQIRNVDEPVYNRCRPLHRLIHNRALVKIGKSAADRNMKSYVEDHPERKRTSSSRVGGIGSILAVSRSTGGGTAFHYDKGDDELVYSTIVVLKSGGTLHLPQTGYKMQVKVGDAVSFLASQQLHKLDVDGDGEQLVFTLWTDRQSRIMATDPKHKASMPRPPKYDALNDFIIAPDSDEDVDGIEGHGSGVQR